MSSSSTSAGSPVPGPAAPVDRLNRHLEAWLGRWPARAPVDVVGSIARERPGWDGRIFPVIGVRSPESGVLSVPPHAVAAVQTVAATLDDSHARHPHPATRNDSSMAGPWDRLLARLPESRVGPDQRVYSGVFRWCERPAALPELGVWVDAGDPSLPDWLRHFGQPVEARQPQRRLWSGISVQFQRRLRSGISGDDQRRLRSGISGDAQRRLRSGISGDDQRRLWSGISGQFQRRLRSGISGDVQRRLRSGISERAAGPPGREVLVAWDPDTGAYLAGVGIKHHDPYGREIAVGTATAAEGRGLARALVAQAARRILDEGAVPTYQHDPANVASARVADAAGFPDRGWRSAAVA